MEQGHLRRCDYTANECSKNATALKTLLAVFAKKKTVSQYDAVKAFLTSINDVVHAKLKRSPVRYNGEKLEFVDHHSTSPIFHPIKHTYDPKFDDTPDILAIPASLAEKITTAYGADNLSKKVPWHFVESIIEIKSLSDRRHGLPQCGAYLGSLNQARPDMPGCYGLSIGPTEFTILYCDPSGAFTSSIFPWKSENKSDDPAWKPIADYIASLYVPPEHHYTNDPTIRACGPDGERDPLQVPCWSFKNVDAGVDDLPFHTDFVGRAYTRMTRVFKPVGGMVLPVVKESYRPPGRRFKEEEIIQHIHKDGIVPGVVQARALPAVVQSNGHNIETFRFSDDLNVDDDEDADELSQLEKTRIILDATGTPLCEAQSVLDFLKVIYDINEAHRCLFKDRNILHRDLSMNNIMCYPEYKNLEPEDVRTKKPPRFINELLDYEKDDPNERNIEPTCLLLDFDSAMRLDKDDTAKILLNTRTGTAVYMARALAQNDWGDLPLFHKLPELSMAKAAYVKIYGQDVYDAHPSATDYEIDKARRKNHRVSHEPRHDVESLYWIIVVFLMRSQPADMTITDDNLDAFQDDWEIFHRHIVPNRIDTRKDFMSREVDDWESSVHPGLKSMAPLLQNLSEQFRPEYHLLVPKVGLGSHIVNRNSERTEEALPETYLHEVLRRLLLEEIMRLTNSNNPLLLNTSEQRQFTLKSEMDAGNIVLTDHRSDRMPSTHISTKISTKITSAKTTSTKKSSKRSYNAIADPEEATSSKRRSKRLNPPQNIVEGEGDGDVSFQEPEEQEATTTV